MLVNDVAFVPPFSMATVPVTFAAVPDTFPVTLPVRFAVMVPALKLPEASRATMAEAVFAFVASVPMVTPVEPLYDVPVRCVPKVRAARFDPSAMPLMVEFASMAFVTVPVSVVYTPLVTVAALPLMLPAIVFVNVCVPSQVFDVVVETERECISGIKAVFSILREPEDPADPVDRMVAELESIVPIDNRKVYDMRKVLDLLSDNGEWTELKSKFGTGILIGLSRIGGRAVAVIANQPQSAGGALDAKGIRKCTAFLEFAVRRRLPVLIIQDHPGFLIGSSVERDGLIRAIANHAAVMETVDVPMVTLVIRKAYGAAYYFLGTGASGAQFVAGWPNAEISFMSPEIGAAIFHKHTDAGTRQEAVKATIEELQREASIWDAASEFWVDAVIMPGETRKIVCRAFDFLC